MVQIIAVLSKPPVVSDTAVEDLASPRPHTCIALAAGWALLVAPVIAHTLWRPLLVAFSGSGDAAHVTVASLGVALVGVAALWRSPGRLLSALASSSAAAVLATIVMSSGDADFRGSLAAGVALLVVAASTCVVAPRIIARLPVDLDVVARRRRGATIAAALLLALAVLQSARLSTFMGDATRSGAAATTPVLPDFGHHSCVTAYIHGAKLARSGAENLYEARWWPSLVGRAEGEPASPDEVAAATDAAAAYAPFGLDAYAYPPPFLLLPRAVLVLSDDFSAQRALWFGLNALFLAFGLVYVSLWIAASAPRAGLRALLLAPLVWTSWLTLITLQVGNVHLSVVVAAVLGMVALESKRPALGGAVLALAILTKISPGLLGVVLLVQRRWHEALWTAGFGLLWTLLALIVFGPAPFEAFVVYELPRLSSGAALEFFSESLTDISINLAPFGIPFKLQALGVAVDDVWARAATVNSVFTAIVVGLTIVAARRRIDRRIDVGLWLAVLTLGGLRSPFAPGYVAFGALWLLTLWVADVRRPAHALGLAIVFIVLSGAPLSGAPLIVFSFAQQATLLALLVWFIARARSLARAP